MIDFRGMSRYAHGSLRQHAERIPDYGERNLALRAEIDIGEAIVVRIVTLTTEAMS